MLFHIVDVGVLLCIVDVNEMVASLFLILISVLRSAFALRKLIMLVCEMSLLSAIFFV